MKSLSRAQLFTIPWTAAHQAPPSMGFSRREYWRRLPLPSPFKGLGKIIGLLVATRMDWRWEETLIIFCKFPGVPHKTKFQYDWILTFCQPCQSTWYQSHTNYIKKNKIIMLYTWGCRFIFAIINLLTSFYLFLISCYFIYTAILLLIPMVWFIFFMLYCLHFSLLHISSLSIHFILFFWWGKIFISENWGMTP